MKELLLYAVATLFNHPQFAVPANNLALGSFGEITATSVNPRLIQLALKYIF